MTFNLVGKITEERELTGNETLTELLKTFTDKNANINPNQFAIPGTNELYFKELEKKRRNIINSVENLMKNVPLSYEIDNIGEASQELVADFVCSELDIKYDRISPDLFKIRRSIDYGVEVPDRYNGGKKKECMRISIPLLASIKFGEEKWNLTTVKDFKDSEYNVSINSKAPPITRDAKQKTKQFISDCMDIISKGLNSPLVGEFLFRDLREGEANLSLDMYWIPEPTDLKIEVTKIQRDPDPFIIGGVYDRKYLVASWNVKGELPYQHYLTEFTESNKKK